MAPKKKSIWSKRAPSNEEEDLNADVEEKHGNNLRRYNRRNRRRKRKHCSLFNRKERRVRCVKKQRGCSSSHSLIIRRRPFKNMFDSSSSSEASNARRDRNRFTNPEICHLNFRNRRLETGSVFKSRSSSVISRRSSATERRLEIIRRILENEEQPQNKDIKSSSKANKKKSDSP